MGVFGLTRVLEGDWEKAEPYVRRAVAQADGTTSVAEIRARVGSNEVACFMLSDGPDAVATVLTEVRVFEAKKVYLITGLAGDGFERWGHWLNAALRALAVSNGCTELQAHGRRGWSRKLAAMGWNERFVCMGQKL
ncbi:MAG: hypothetical protein ACRC52_04435 [Aeromonas veronii]